MPVFLRQHLSCSLCRSHIKEHLIDLGVPTSRRGIDWAYYFWRAHNFVNEQSEVTRCGSMDCQWGSWNSPADATLAPNSLEPEPVAVASESLAPAAASDDELAEW